MFSETETSHERQVYAHFIFPTQQQAQDFAVLIPEQQWKVSVDFAAERGHWRVAVERQILILHREISVWLATLTARATAAGGDYDGWGRVVF